MFTSASGFTMRFARVVVALAFLIVNTAFSHAQGLAGSAFLQRSSGSFAGPAATLGVRIPFGGEGTAQPMVGLSFGSTWRANLGSTNPQAYRFIPTVEAGFSLRGDPILRLGAFEAKLDQLRASAEGAAQGETFCGRHLSLCIIGGVALVGGLVLALGDWESCSYSGQYPPGQDPCGCYEPDGCD